MNPDTIATTIKHRFPSLIRLDIANTFWKRALGLMGKHQLERGTGLLIPNCRSIHTGFMRFPLDVIFLDENNRVAKVVRNVKPWRMVWGGWKACSVLEVQCGWLPE